MDTAVKKHVSGELPALSPGIDRILKWIPVASVLLTDAEKTETGNQMTKRLKTIALAETILNSALLPLKKFISRRRPDSNLTLDSFPSGHTATSFMGAEILNQSAKESSPSLRLAGYAVATATAAMRVYKKKHWLSDVVAGAVLGIAAAKIAVWIVNKQIQKHPATAGV